MGGRVFRVYKGPLGSLVEVVGSPPMRPARARQGSACRSRVAASEGLPPPKRPCTGGSRSWRPLRAHNPLEDTFLATAERLATEARRAGGVGGAGGGGPDQGDRVHEMAPLYLDFMQRRHYPR